MTIDVLEMAEITHKHDAPRARRLPCPARRVKLPSHFNQGRSMELHEQIDAVQRLIDRLASAGLATSATSATSEASEASATSEASALPNPAARTANDPTPPRLHFNRPSQNEIVVTLGEHSVTLGPADISAIIEELAIARASMTPEPPATLPPGWRFAATQDPAIATQSHNNGSKLVVFRHTGYGWVPFTFTPNMVMNLLAALSAK
ncbi:hypothetical protein [Mycetohabitans sp. B8]|uniref:hypothetical protein n=1 Tax=Mycetohabitans sp. B8 TaxID=2841845 RepID=UPI001F40976B|nr:hypothetical protein [Mycetohabitans sp. B8]